MNRSALVSTILGLAMLGLVGTRIADVLGYRPSGTRSKRCGWVNLKEPERPSSTDAVPTTQRAFLKVVVTPVLSSVDIPRRFSRLVSYLAKRLSLEPVLLHLEPYSEVDSLLRHQKCDVALVCSGPYVKGERDYGLEALALPQVSGATTGHSLILVPSSSKATSLLDLKGGRFVSVAANSTSGWFFPALWLQRNGQDANRFFAEHVSATAHEQAIQAVDSGAADGAAASSLVYEHLVALDPALASRTRIILRSAPFGNPVLAVHPKMDAKFKGALRSLLLGMHENPQGRRALDAAGIDRFVLVPGDHFSSVKEMIRDWEALQ